MAHAWVHQPVGARRAFVIFIGVFATGYLWSNWDAMRGRPGVAQLIEWAGRPSLPHVQPSEYTVLVARLEGGADGSYEKLILESLSELPAVHLYQKDRPIARQGAERRVAESQAVEEAQGYLRKTDAHIVL